MSACAVSGTAAGSQLLPCAGALKKGIPLCGIPFSLRYSGYQSFFASSIMISLERAMNFVIASEESGAFCSFARS